MSFEDISAYIDGIQFAAGYKELRFPVKPEVAAYDFVDQSQLERFFVINLPFFTERKIRTKVIGNSMLVWKPRERNGPDGLPPMSKPETESHTYPAA